jgi:hypothetical protein
MQNVERMSITLPADMARMIRAKVDEGGYAAPMRVARRGTARSGITVGWAAPDACSGSTLASFAILLTQAPAQLARYFKTMRSLVYQAVID